MHASDTAHTVRRVRLRTGMAPFLALLLAVALLAAACGQASAGGGKPTGFGTPVSGVPQVLGPATGGQYESVFASGGATYLGSANGIVYAFDSSSGHPLWRRTLPGSASLFAVANQVLYVEASTGSSTVAYALDAAAGTVLWHYTFPTEVMGLTVAGGAVFANDDYPSSAGSTVYALRASDGSLLWRYTAPIEVPQPVEAVDGIVYAEGNAPSGGLPSLYALRASDGALLWNYRATGEFALPTVAYGVAYLAIGDGPVNVLDAVSTATGARQWRFTADAGQSFIGRQTIPTVANGVVYVAASGMVYALGANDGRVLWRASRAYTGGAVAEWPVVGDGAVYFREGELANELAAVRASDGHALWQQQVGNGIMGLSEGQGLIQVLTQTNNVYGLRASDGAMLWRQPIDNFAGWNPASPPYSVAGGILFVAAEKGTLQAIRASDGTLLWHAQAPAPEVLSPPVYGAFVTFASGISYGQALREVSDLGLAVGALCEPPGVAWSPLDQGFAQFHRLIVYSTALSEPDWLAPLRTLPGVTDAQPSGAVSCPLLRPAPPGTPAALAPNAAGTLVRLTFSVQTSYEAALATTITLGFRLTNPCYEQQSQGARVAWTPMGQQQTFGATHTLLVLTTTYNSTIWQQQARSAPGVTRAELGPAVTCTTP